MYSFIALSDIHLGWKLFNLPELAQDLKDCFSSAIDIAIAKKVNYVFIVGDLFDTNRPSPDLVRFVHEQVDKAAANGIVVAGIAGDHDKPVNGSAWVHLSGCVPISSIHRRFVGLDYTDISGENIQKLAEMSEKDRSNVEWIFLHGQVPELFSFTEDKKKLDIKSIDPLNAFPKLKGVILGDIHTPLEGTIADPTQTRAEPYIGYCGSLGVIKTDEIGTKEGILYFDGEKIQRIPFKTDREFIRLNLGDSFEPINWIEKYCRFFSEHKGKKPVFIIEHDKKSKELLPNAAPLYDIGIVKVSTKRATADNQEEETINIRSELKTNNRVEEALKDCVPDTEVFELILSMLNTEDPKSVLDQFKETALNA